MTKYIMFVSRKTLVNVLTALYFDFECPSNYIVYQCNIHDAAKSVAQMHLLRYVTKHLYQAVHTLNICNYKSNKFIL